MASRQHEGQITVVAAWAERARDLFLLADHDDERGDDFVDLVAYVLHTTVSPRWGLNYKRAGSEQSKDCLAWLRTDDDGSQRFVEVIDVVGGAGGPNPHPAWQDQTNYVTLGQPNTARWFMPTREGWMEPYLTGVAPQPEPAPQPAPKPQPAPAPACKFNLGDVNTGIAAILLRLGALEQRISEVHDLAANAEYEARNAAGRASEIKDQLARGFHADLNGRLGMNLAMSGAVRPAPKPSPDQKKE